MTDQPKPSECINCGINVPSDSRFYYCDVCRDKIMRKAAHTICEGCEFRDIKIESLQAEHTHLLEEKQKRIEELENGCKELIAERHPAAFKEWATAQVTMENTDLLKRIEALEAALEEIASQAMRETNFKEQYDQDGYGFIIKKCKEALAASAKGV